MENYKQHSWTYNTNLIKVSTRNNQDIEVEISSPNCNFNKQRLFIKSILKEDIQSDDFIRRINKMIACNE